MNRLLVPVFIALGGVIAVGVVLAVVRPEWLDYFMITIGIVIGVVVLTPIYLLYKFLRWIWNVILSKIAKSILFILSILLVTPIVFVTAGIPWIGKGFFEFKDQVIALMTTSVELPKLGKELRDVRGMMIRILVEVDDPEPDFSRRENYQKELRDVRKNGEKSINTGETVLSLSLGALMLISQFWGLAIFQTSFLGVVADFVIQVGLLVIGVSIGYRLAVMDFLAFSGEEQFESLKEMDVAVSYQKGVCSVAFVQHLMSMIVLVMVLFTVKKDLAEDLLRLYYSGMSFSNTMKEGWKRLNETQ